jgi:hypothetical protein
VVGDELAMRLLVRIAASPHSALARRRRHPDSAVVDLVKSLAGGKEPHKSANPDEVVAMGAYGSRQQAHPAAPSCPILRACLMVRQGCLWRYA